MRPGAAWGAVGAVALLLASGVAVATAPGNARIIAPLLVRGGVGDTMTGRTLIAEVTQVRLAEALDVKYRDAGDTSTDGVWVVVDATLTATEKILGFTDAELRIGDVIFTPSHVLPSPTLMTLRYGAGIPEHGSLVFEIPLSALDQPGASAALLVFRNDNLDSTPALQVDLTALEIEPRVRVDEIYVADRE